MPLLVVMGENVELVKAAVPVASNALLLRFVARLLDETSSADTALTPAALLDCLAATEVTRFRWVFVAGTEKSRHLDRSEAKAWFRVCAFLVGAKTGVALGKQRSRKQTGIAQQEATEMGFAGR